VKSCAGRTWRGGSIDLIQSDSRQTVHRNRGDAYFWGKGDKERAIADYTRAIELEPGEAIAYSRRGAVFEAKGDSDRAVIDYTKAIALEVDPKKAPFYARAMIYLKKGQYDLAASDFTKTIEVNPSEGYARRASAYLKAGKPAQALPDAEHALKLDGSLPVLLELRGLILEALGRRDDAIGDFRLALSKRPNLQDSREALERLGANP